MTTEEEKKLITFKEFLENVPPGRFTSVESAERTIVGRSATFLDTPQLYLYCDNEKCKGWRFFGPTAGDIEISSQHLSNRFISYYCMNCKNYIKTFAISVIIRKDADIVFKYGENPSFGPPTPPRATTLIRPDKELFFTGRRAENQGMGIGAFTYYRRVVENQKNRIFDEIIRVTKKISPGDPIIQELEDAKKQFQFTKAVETIKHAMPQSLLINGYNPLTLLYSALSEGVHDQTDAECLELASDIREVLFEFAEKLGQALKEDAKIAASAKRLAEKTKKKGGDN